jgi:hypothetical protein
MRQWESCDFPNKAPSLSGPQSFLEEVIGFVKENLSGAPQRKAGHLVRKWVLGKDSTAPAHIGIQRERRSQSQLTRLINPTPSGGSEPAHIIS